MNTRKRFLVILMAAMLVVAILSSHGCKKSGKAAAASIDLCVKCGQIKESELCCKPVQTKCPKCGLVKGSPGCCNIPEGAESAAICVKCGQIKDSDLCCKPNQNLCDKCCLVKGSPGCCMIPKI